jgi:hypothetical protein
MLLWTLLTLVVVLVLDNDDGFKHNHVEWGEPNVTINTLRSRLHNLNKRF